MKLISFRHGAIDSYGLVDDQQVLDLGDVAGAEAPDLKTALAKGLLSTLAERPAPILPLSSVTLLPTLPNPGKIFCVGHN